LAPLESLSFLKSIQMPKSIGINIGLQGTLQAMNHGISIAKMITKQKLGCLMIWIIKYLALSFDSFEELNATTLDL